MAAAGAKARRRKELFPGTKSPMVLITPSGTYRRRDSNDCPGWPASHAAASIKAPATMRKPA